jgi:hypothetical protein
MAVPLLDLLLPGAGLTLRGRLVPGLICLVLAVINVSTVILGRILLASALAAQATWWGISVYVLAGLSAAGMHLWIGRQRAQVDEATLRQEHRRIAAAFLTDRGQEALLGARSLAQRAKREPGAWRLLELVANRNGQAQEAAKAGKRAQSLEREREDLAA